MDLQKQGNKLISQANQGWRCPPAEYINSVLLLLNYTKLHFLNTLFVFIPTLPLLP